MRSLSFLYFLTSLQHFKLEETVHCFTQKLEISPEEQGFLSAWSSENWKETETLQLFLNLERHAIKCTAGPSTPLPFLEGVKLCFWPKGLKKWGGVSHWHLFFRFSMEMKYFSFFFHSAWKIIDKTFESKLFCTSSISYSVHSSITNLFW